jgi:hypothetical protein
VDFKNKGCLVDIKKCVHAFRRDIIFTQCNMHFYIRVFNSIQSREKFDGSENLVLTNFTAHDENERQELCSKCNHKSMMTKNLKKYFSKSYGKTVRNISTVFALLQMSKLG